MVGKFKTKVKLVQSERADKLKEMERKQLANFQPKPLAATTTTFSLRIL